MLFNSYAFLFFFLPAVLACYHALRGRNARLGLLIGASWLFYAWWNFAFSLLMLAFCAVNYSMAGRIHASSRPGGRRAWMIALVGLDLGVLGFFKYQALFSQLLGFLDLSDHAYLLPLRTGAALPIAISFYTFQGISYAVDLYRGRIEPARGLAEFVCFKLFFPQLIAGPIVRFGQIASQLAVLRTDWEAFAKGICWFSVGLAKKIILADTLARTADAAFNGGGYAGLDAYLALVAFTFQIYFDFSAYSDMACGLALMFGVRLPRNFDSPYKARSLTEFWHRWHMTLSEWLRDYLYIPLGGNRKGKVRMYLALVLTMLLGGLWHGASYTFALWGLFHGLLLCLEKGLGDRHPLRRLPGVVQTAITFHLVMAAWVFFRCQGFGEAMDYFRALFTWSGAGPRLVEGRTLALLLACASLAWWTPNLQQLRFRLNGPWLAGSLACLALGIALLMGREPMPFIYFRF